MPSKTPRECSWFRRLLGLCKHHSSKMVIEAIGLTGLIGIAGLLISLHWIGPDSGYGSCNLKPSTPANIDALRAHLQAGLQYESNGKYDFAEREFKEVLNIDPHFIGASLDLGYAYLAQKNWDKAEESFKNERDSVECLSTVWDRNLREFDYMLTSGTNFVTGGQRSTDYRQRLESLEDAVHYNLACLRLKQGDMDGAKSELKQAAKNCSISTDKFQNDPDLAPAREDRNEFLALISCPSKPR